jgi:hypothetical protein
MPPMPLDATTIDLCLSLFPWAPLRSTKAAVKMHTLLDLRGSIPSFIHISNGKLHDVRVLDLLIPEPGAFYVMDRGFERLYALHQAGSFFVTRAKSNLGARRIYSAPTDRTTGVICDQTVALNGHYSEQHYPEHLRRIRFNDTKKARHWCSSPIKPPYRQQSSAPSTRLGEKWSCFLNGSNSTFESSSSAAIRKTP